MDGNTEYLTHFLLLLSSGENFIFTGQTVAG
jgi:hypothetical protein